MMSSLKFFSSCSAPYERFSFLLLYDLLYISFMCICKYIFHEKIGNKLIILVLVAFMWKKIYLNIIHTSALRSSKTKVTLLLSIKDTIHKNSNFEDMYFYLKKRRTIYIDFKYIVIRTTRLFLLIICKKCISRQIKYP